VANRLQNIVITLDKVRMFLAQQEQPQEPCLRRLTDEEVLDHLWNGPKSVARRLLRGAAQVLAPLETVRSIAMAQTTLELHKAVADARAKMPESLQKLADAALVDATSAADARQRLMQFSTLLREADMAVGGGLTAAADICALYASTQKWITNEKGYAGVTSPPVPINLQDLFLNREATQLLPAPGAGSANATMDQAAMQAHAEKAAAAMARHHASE